jgi:pimeloyl-ACP methyl ester carboxylesterase
VLSVLREFHEDEASRDTGSVYASYVSVLPDTAAAARIFVNYWNGEGAWDSIGGRARSAIAALVPKVEQEMTTARADTTPLATLAASPPRTTILCGEKTKNAPRATAKHLARAFNARVLEVAGAGHMIPLTHPQAIVEATLAPQEE